MAGRRRRRREDEDHSYWLSYSDMMAGLLLMFVIIISFTMMQAKRQYERDAKELAKQQGCNPVRCTVHFRIPMPY